MAYRTYGYYGIDEYYDDEICGRALDEAEEEKDDDDKEDK